MKWYIIIGTAFIIIAIGSYVVFFSGSPTESVNNPQPTAGLPISGSITPNPSTSGGGTATSSPTISFATPSGAVVTVKDFIHNGETVQDVQNPGSYVLAGSLGYCLADGSCPKGASTMDFSVSYDEKNHFFNIILLAEPLGAVRLEAERFIANRLGLAGKDACNLNYFVGTPYWVNAAYDDRNLGFSFCPGATPLPK
ncbi:MAG: hypothetical protein NUV90_02175 [Candidatus Parcubacteria bacterium]|nr:hypothetical protein [Candidatus Parcubacteria bacterium]